jgi:protein-tyrosine phosphatase
MIDFHTHILFDIDDGPTTLEESVAMARLAYKDGTHTIVATPHSPGWDNRYTVELVLSRVATLRQALDEQGIPVTILPGGELFYDANLVAQLQAGKVLTCGGSHTVLVECPIYEDLPTKFEQLLFALQVAGYRVVLAHPERINDVRRDPNVLIPFIERGMYTQLTAQTLTVDMGNQDREFVETLLTHNLIHLVASDAHGVDYRPPLLAQARQQVVKLLGEEAAQMLFEDVAKGLLDDQPIPVPAPQRVAARRRWFG